MRRLLPAALLTAVILSLPASAQTHFPIATLGGNDNPLVTTNGPVTYRYGIDHDLTLTGVDCSIAPQCWLPAVTATLTNFQTLWSTFPSDPAPGISKRFEIAEKCTVQTGTIGGVAFTIPALPASSCSAPSTTMVFSPNTSYTVSVTNIPPAAIDSPLQGQVTISIGSVSVSLVCTYGTTLATTGNPAAMQAVFTCIPLPATVPSQ